MRKPNLRGIPREGIVSNSDLPGVVLETLPSGSIRCRVSEFGRQKSRVTMPCGPEHPDFYRLYKMAREGNLKDIPVEYKFKATGDVTKEIYLSLNRAQKRAKARGMEYDIDRQFFVKMLERQKFRCAVSGILFDFTEANGKRRPFSPSIDRIDNSRGYTRDNVRLTCVMVNIALSDWSDKDFKTMCKAVAEKGGQ